MMPAAVRNNRFSLLMIMLMLSFIVLPLLLEISGQVDTPASHWIIIAVSALLLAAATFAVSNRRRVMYFTLVLMTASFIVEVFSQVLPSNQAAILHHILRVTFFGFIIIELLRVLFQPQKVTFDTISASLCVYLLIGALWANFYAICELLVPGSIGILGSHDAQAAAKVSEMARLFRMLYFSLVTLSTVGYGDVVPLTPTTRMLAATEAIVGQIYLLVMVSRLVGIHVAQTLAPLSGTPLSPLERRDGDEEIQR